MRKLIEASKTAMENAYAPYSNFRVGAAALLLDGTIITGCNIENASYGLCNCAERTTLFSVYAQGYTKEDIVAFAVCAHTKNPVSPCGACRQVMNELLEPSVPVFLTNTNFDVKETTVEQLLPYAFNEAI